MGYIGWGLSQEVAENIRNYKTMKENYYYISFLDHNEKGQSTYGHTLINQTPFEYALFWRTRGYDRIILFAREITKKEYEEHFHTMA